MKNPLPKQTIWLAVGLALAAALTYVLMALNVLGVGDLAAAEKPAGIVYAAAGGYVLGGLLILLRRRWLWVIGALINGIVLLVFFNFYAERPSVLLSPGGLVSKVAQILLELALFVLIFSQSRRAKRVQERFG